MSPIERKKYVALKSLGISEKTKALEAETDEESEDESKEDDELSLMSRRVNQLQKKRQVKFRGQRRTDGHFESTYGSKKDRVRKELKCFRYKEPGHFKNECLKLKKEMPKKNFRGKKKGLMVTWDDSQFSQDDYEEEQTNMVLVPCIEAHAETIQLESELD